MDKKERASGFYWVTDALGLHWFVARYISATKSWRVTGSNGTPDDSMFGKIDEQEILRDEEKWIHSTDRLPEKEGRYLCTGVGGWHEVRNFKFYRDRATGAKWIDEDGITGCFSDNLGYSSEAIHWMTLPELPQKTTQI